MAKVLVERSVVEQVLGAAEALEKNRGVFDERGSTTVPFFYIREMVSAMATLRAALTGAEAYAEQNPLGGPAKVFDAMADAIRAGDDYHATLRRYGFAEIKQGAAPEQPEQEPARPSPHLAKPFGGVLPWGENPTDETKIWFSFRGPDGFIWQDGQWVWVAPTVISDLRAPPATPEQRKLLADSMWQIFGGAAQGRPDVPEAGFGESREPVAMVLQTGGNAGIATRIVEIDYPLREHLRAGTLLYTAPTPRKPLTNEEIGNVIQNAAGYLYAQKPGYLDQPSWSVLFFDFVRAIIAAYEAKNGITGEGA